MRYSLILLIICAIQIVPLYGQSDNKPDITQLVNFIVLGTGSTTGTYYPLGRAFANMWSDKIEGLEVMAFSTRGSVDNLRLMQKRELNFAIAQGDITLSALKGTGNFANSPINELRVLMSLFPEVVQIVVHAESKIKSIDDLKGRRVVVGPQGSGNALTSVEILSARGIELDDFEPVYISYDESIQAMERKDCDAAIIIAGTPTQAVAEMGKRFQIRVLSFSAEEYQYLTKELEYLTLVDIDQNTYKNQNDRVDTLALMAMLVADSRMSDEMAYKLCKVIFSNLESLRQAHERAGDISVKTFTAGIPLQYLHPGAKKFLAEKQ
ncbi:MAG: TAXI family TRAP transporter solute-binding subunit [Candidatus Rifleibacteriota bacterium]